jgi:hypothetical protein
MTGIIELVYSNFITKCDVYGFLETGGKKE